MNASDSDISSQIQEYVRRQQQLQRRTQLTQNLQASSLQPNIPQQTGAVAPRMSIANVLAQLGTAWFGTMAAENADKESAALNAQRLNLVQSIIGGGQGSMPGGAGTTAPAAQGTSSADRNTISGLLSSLGPAPNGQGPLIAPPSAPNQASAPPSAPRGNPLMVASMLGEIDPGLGKAYLERDTKFNEPYTIGRRRYVGDQVLAEAPDDVSANTQATINAEAERQRVALGQQASEAAASRGVTMRGQDLTHSDAQARLNQEGDAQGRKDAQANSQLTNTLRDEFNNQSKSFVTVRDFYNRMKNAKETGPGDMSLVFSYMKVLDPTSTVREGEYATAANSGGVPASVLAEYNKLVGGGVLAPELRMQIRSQADSIYQAQLNTQKANEARYKDLASRQGLDPSQVITDLTQGVGTIAPPAPPPPGAKPVPGAPTIKPWNRPWGK